MPLAGARVLLQARSVSRRGELVSELPLAEAVTDASGRWALPVLIGPSKRGVSLRALFEGSTGHGAAVSEPLDVPGAVAVSQPQPAPPPSSPPPGPQPPGA